MEAIKRIIGLEEASTIEEMDREMLAAHEAVNDLHLHKLASLADEATRRLGVRASSMMNVGMSPMTPSDERRRPKDEPQA